MAIWQWITHRTDAVGWESFRHVARFAGLSTEDCEALEDLDDFEVIRSPRKRRALALALCATVKDLYAIDIGTVEDVPMNNRQMRTLAAVCPARGVDAEVSAFDEDWPPKPPPSTPVLGELSRSGEFEPGDHEPLPVVFGMTGTIFALRVAPGDTWRVYRMTGRDNWREGEDCAVYVADDYDGRGYAGRVHIVESRIELQLRDNSRIPIDRDRVVRKARECNLYPPPLNATPTPAGTHSVNAVKPDPDKPCTMQMMARLAIGTPSKERDDDDFEDLETT